MRLTITGAPGPASPQPLVTPSQEWPPTPHCQPRPPLVAGDQQLVPAWARPVHLACPPHTCTRGKNGKMLSELRIIRSLNESLLLLRSIVGSSDLFPLLTRQPWLPVSGWCWEMLCLSWLGAAPMTQDITADKLTQNDTISTFTGSQPQPQVVSSQFESQYMSMSTINQGGRWIFFWIYFFTISTTT